MNQFTIRDIENLCGVKAHTLRIWEQRYNLFTPKRKESKHRIYDCDDLKELLRICFLYHQGYKISKIAELTPEQIKEQVNAIKLQSCPYELYVHQMIEASVELDEEAFEKLVNCLVLRVGLEKCIPHVFYPFLERIGLLWMTNHVIPAQEHFSTQIIGRKIISGIDGLEAPINSKPRVIVFAPLGEMHELPLLVMNYYLRKYGVATYYFGVNTALPTLQYFIRHHEITHIYMHVITHFDNRCLSDVVNSYCNSFPGQSIIISGPASHNLKFDRKNLKQLHSLEESIAFARMLSMQ